MVTNGPIRLNPYAKGGFFKNVNLIREPALLAVNRQIRTESLRIFYGENTFQISNLQIARCTLENLDRYRNSCLRKLEIDFEHSWFGSQLVSDKVHVVRQTLAIEGLRRDAVFLRVESAEFFGDRFSMHLVDLRPFEVVRDGDCSVVHFEARSP